MHNTELCISVYYPFTRQHIFSHSWDLRTQYAKNFYIHFYSRFPCTFLSLFSSLTFNIFYFSCLIVSSFFFKTVINTDISGFWQWHLYIEFTWFLNAVQNLVFQEQQTVSKTWYYFVLRWKVAGEHTEFLSDRKDYFQCLDNLSQLWN